MDITVNVNLQASPELMGFFKSLLMSEPAAKTSVDIQPMTQMKAEVKEAPVVKSEAPVVECLDDIKALVRQHIDDKREEIKKLLSDCGVKRVSDIPIDKQADFLTALKQVVSA